MWQRRAAAHNRLCRGRRNRHCCPHALGCYGTAGEQTRRQRAAWVGGILKPRCAPPPRRPALSAAPSAACTAGAGPTHRGRCWWVRCWWATTISQLAACRGAGRHLLQLHAAARSPPPVSAAGQQRLPPTPTPPSPAAPSATTAPEVADEALHGPGSGVSQGADGVPLDLLGHLPQHVNLLEPAGSGA